VYWFCGRQPFRSFFVVVVFFCFLYYFMTLSTRPKMSFALTLLRRALMANRPASVETLCHSASVFAP
jgi:hypothetical protein